MIHEWFIYIVNLFFIQSILSPAYKRCEVPYAWLMDHCQHLTIDNSIIKGDDIRWLPTQLWATIVYLVEVLWGSAALQWLHSTTMCDDCSSTTTRGGYNGYAAPLHVTVVLLEAVVAILLWQRLLAIVGVNWMSKAVIPNDYAARRVSIVTHHNNYGGR